MEEGRDNHQETDKRAIVKQANSGGGFRKPKLERKPGNRWDLGFIRKLVDSSAETTISRCLHQRGTTPRWSSHQTLRARKDKSSRIEDSICPFSSWEEILKCTQEGFMSPQRPSQCVLRGPFSGAKTAGPSLKEKSEQLWPHLSCRFSSSREKP